MSAASAFHSPRIRSAANDAVALAQLLRLATGQSSYHTQDGHLGFAYVARQDGSLVMLVEWREQQKLLVEQFCSKQVPLRIKLYDRGGPWDQELAQAVQFLRECVEARRSAGQAGTQH